MTGLGGARLVGRDGSWQPAARMFPSTLNDLLMISGLAAHYPPSQFFGRADRTWANPSEPPPSIGVAGAYGIIRKEVLDQWGSRPKILPLLRGGRPVPTYQGCGISDLVLARRGDCASGWRIVEKFRTRTVVVGNSTDAVADAQRTALLPKTSWRSGAWSAMLLESGRIGYASFAMRGRRRQQPRQEPRGADVCRDDEAGVAGD